MAITIDEIAKHLEALELNYKKRDDEHLLLIVRMEHYRDEDGDDGLRLVIRLMEDGEYFSLFAPNAFKAVGEHTDAFLRACASIQWRTKLIQFEYDTTDGEIRPTVEFPIEDGTLTQTQLHRCIKGLCSLIDDYYPVLKKALDEGVVEFPPDPSMVTMVQGLVNRMLTDLGPEDRAAVLRKLTEGAGGAQTAEGGGTPPREL